MNAFTVLPDPLTREVKLENEEAISPVVRCNGLCQECLNMASGVSGDTTL